MVIEYAQSARLTLSFFLRFAGREGEESGTSTSLLTSLRARAERFVETGIVSVGPSAQIEFLEKCLGVARHVSVFVVRQNGVGRTGCDKVSFLGWANLNRQGERVRGYL